MGFADDVRAATMSKGPQCVIGALLAGDPLQAEDPLSPSEVEELRQMCDNPASVSGNAVTRALKRRGYSLGAASFSRHARTKACGCWR